jgi:Hypothetical protein (DUF2513)
MKRDWECIRAILVALEEKGDTGSAIRSTEIQGFDGETTAYNMKLLLQADLIEGQCAAGLGFPVTCSVVSMTWHGHELLDKMKSGTVWNKIKASARERAIPLSFDAIKLLGTEAIKNLIGG